LKYRKKVFINDATVDFLKTTTREMAETFSFDVLEIECDKDRFHMHFKSSPLINIPQSVNAVKTITLEEIQRRFPNVKKELWKEKF
jgi:putative transposase